MWPPLGHPWPSSISVCASRGSGSKKFSLGVCSGTSLQRSRRASVAERVRDLDIADNARFDGRRLEVAGAVSLWRGAQVSHRHRAGVPSSIRTGQKARLRKERTHPELAGEGGRARLVVLAEVGGRWSGETAQFLEKIGQGSLPDCALDPSRACCILACSSAFATSLLERRPTPGTGSEVPSVNEVLGDARFV